MKTAESTQTDSSMMITLVSTASKTSSTQTHQERPALRAQQDVITQPDINLDRIAAGAVAISNLRSNVTSTQIELQVLRLRVLPLDEDKGRSEVQVAADAEMASMVRDFQAARDTQVVVLKGTSYRLAGLLGKGGHGEVFKALTSDGAWALKVEQRRNEHMNAVRQQMRWACSLRHANVALTEAWDEVVNPHYTTVYSVMELGTELFALSAQDALPQHLKLRVVAGVADGVAHLHQHQLVHADLDCGNVIMVGGVAKLMDFGTLQPVGTDNGGAVGKYESSAPEKVKVWWQCTGSPATFAWDTFAIGLLGHCVFAKGCWPGGRHHLFDQANQKAEVLRTCPKFLAEECGGNPGLVESKLAEEKLKGVVNFLAHLASSPELHTKFHVPHMGAAPPAVVALVQQCWAFDPNERPAASQVAEQLRRIAADSTAGDSPGTAMPDPTASRHSIDL